jgi:outer membrane receptor protein involved in Fe transport
VEVVGGASTETDALGRFLFPRLVPGEYTLRVRMLGRRPAERSVRVASGEATRVDVELAVNPIELPEIAVISEKFVRDLQGTRSSVHVTSDETIERYRIRDWREMARQVGNFTANAFGDFQIRGVGSTGVGFGGSGPTAQIYLDGMPQSSQAVRFGSRGLWDVESVEVFRGPQSTVTGRNALAGAVHLRTRDPEFTWGAAGRLARTAPEGTEAAFMITGPLVEDQLAFRVSGEYLFQDTDFRYPTLQGEVEGLDELETTEHRSVSTRLLFTPADLPRFAARLSWKWSHDRPRNTLRSTEERGEVREDASPFAALFEGDVHNVALEMTWDFSGSLRLTSVSGYHRTERSRDGLSYVVPGTFSPNGLVGTYLQDDWQQELRLNLETERIRAVGGLYGIQLGFDNRNRILANVQEVVDLPIPILYDADANIVRDTDNLAAFGEVNVQVHERLELTAGARWDRERVDVVSRTVAELSSSDPGLVPDELLPEIPDETFSLATTFEAFLPKVGATVSLSEQVSLGASAQRGYRAGGAEILPSGETNTFEPEYTWNYEVAGRSRWAGGRLEVNGNVFFTDWTDQQLLIPLPEAPGLSRTENVGSSTLQGGELEVRALPTAALSLFASLGITRTEFEEFSTVEGGEPVDYAGREFPRAVGEQVTLGGIWEPLGGPLEGLSASADVAWTGEYFSDPANTPVLLAGGFTQVGARIGWGFDWAGTRATLSLFGQNLLDDTIVLQRDVSTLVGPGAYLGQPRIVGITLDFTLD